MQVSQIVKVLQERYQPEDELIVDWWDKETFDLFCEHRGCTPQVWKEVVDMYENLDDSVQIADIWYDIIEELEREEEGK
jgi:hypothetical protein